MRAMTRRTLELRGPIEDLPWATTLRARVFTPGPRPRSHGLDVYGDLAQHYRASDVMLTSLRGEPPDQAESDLFDAVLVFFAPFTVNEAPAHAALLTRACGASISSVATVGAALLAEHTTELIERHAALLGWLGAPSSPFPAEFRCCSTEEREVVGLLARRVERSGLRLPILDHDPTLVAGLLAACHRCGLEGRESLASVIIAARLPGLLAEGFAADHGDRRSYPIDVPHFQYVHVDVVDVAGSEE